MNDLRALVDNGVRMIVGGDAENAAAQLTTLGTGEGDHYVYIHRRLDGTVFYVGKGVNRRAYSRDRQDIWHHYVKTRCGGQYEVVIVKRFADDEAALNFENDLMVLYGPTLVNWASYGRPMDLAVNAEFHRLRKANWAIISEATAVAASDSTIAEGLYRKAIANFQYYSRLVWEWGLVAELCNEIRPSWNCHLNASDLAAVDKLTLLMKTQKRFGELVDEVNRFFALYPECEASGMGMRLQKRRDMAIRSLKGRNK